MTLGVRTLTELDKDRAVKLRSMIDLSIQDSIRYAENRRPDLATKTLELTQAALNELKTIVAKVDFAPPWNKS